MRGADPAAHRAAAIARPSLGDRGRLRIGQALPGHAGILPETGFFDPDHSLDQKRRKMVRLLWVEPQVAAFCARVLQGQQHVLAGAIVQAGRLEQQAIVWVEQGRQAGDGGRSEVSPA